MINARKRLYNTILSLRHPISKQQKVNFNCTKTAIISIYMLKNLIYIIIIYKFIQCIFYKIMQFNLIIDTLIYIVQ